MNPKVSNILSVYNDASSYALRTGLSWYVDANNFARTVGGGRPEHLSRNAGIIAALSPLNGWGNNKRSAAILISKRGRVEIQPNGSNGIGLSLNVSKAVRIYNGSDPLDVLRGNKVRAFYQTILDPAGDFDPVIDRHAFDIAIGRKTNGQMRSRLDSDRVYHAFGKAYRNAAHTAGISPAQMQAVTWVAWREMGGVID